MTDDIDMDAYHAREDELPPGGHKVFNLSPAIHTFNERFTGQPEQPPLAIATGQTYFEDQEHKDFVNKSLKNPWSRPSEAPNYLFPDEAFRQYPTATPELLPSYGGKEDYLRKYYGTDINKDNVDADLTPQRLQPWGGKEISMKDEPPKMFPDIIPMVKDMKHKSGEESLGPAGDLRNTVIKMRQQGMLKQDIAERLGISAKRIQRMKLDEEPFWNEKTEGQLKDMLDRGLTYQDVAQTMNITRGAVSGRARRLGLQEKQSLGEPSTPPIKLGPEYEQDPAYIAALSKWMKNQFEGAPVESSKQTIYQAALRHPDTGKVYEGSSHALAIDRAAEDYPGYDVYNQKWEEGFTTNSGRFVDRKEAAKIAKEAGQGGGIKTREGDIAISEKLDLPYIPKK